MNKMVGLVPALLLAAAVQAQEDNNDQEKNPFLDTPPGELRQLIADAPEVLKKDWYQVEMVIFTREDPVTDEYWRLEGKPDLTSSVIRLGRASEDKPQLPDQATDAHRAAAERKAWRALDEEKHNLEQMIERMLDRGDYRILFHESWRQPVSKRNRAFPIYVQGGERIMPALQKRPDESASSGSSSTSMSAKSDGNNEEGISGNTDRNTGSAFRPGATLALPEMRGTLRLYVSRYLHIEPNLWLTDQDARGRRYRVQIDHSRRMRSEELHYLDHPKFGLLIQINPWQSEKQKELEQMEEALEKQKEQEE